MWYPTSGYPRRRAAIPWPISDPKIPILVCEKLSIEAPDSFVQFTGDQRVEPPAGIMFIVLNRSVDSCWVTRKRLAWTLAWLEPGGEPDMSTFSADADAAGRAPPGGRVFRANAFKLLLDLIGSDWSSLSRKVTQVAQRAGRGPRRCGRAERSKVSSKQQSGAGRSSVP